MIEVRVPSRVSVGLVGMSQDGYRINGGIGWAVETPGMVTRAETSRTFQLVDQRSSKLDERELAALLRVLEEAKISASLDSAMAIQITGNLLPHRGQGGGTALRLAALESLFMLNRREVSRAELVKLSVRGGTSGVGVRTYFDGGFVFDIGHKSADRPKPSHAWVNPNQPLNVVRFDMPHWQMGMCVPSWLPSITHAEESAFFASVLPISHHEVKDVLYHMIYGTLAAVAEDDLVTFTESIDAIQGTAWKAAEWARYGEELTQIAAELREAGARGIGMSSLGPTLYFDATHLAPTKLGPKIERVTYLTRPANAGRTLTFG